jgi:P pilus assembly chaperone PapD
MLATSGPGYAQAPASSIDVAPTTLDLKGGEAGLFYVTNHGTRPLTIEIEALDWRQLGDNGTDTLSPSETLFTSPPVARIAPETRQSVRVMAQPGADRREGTYRLRVSELPDPAGARNGVHVLLQFSIPVFVGHVAGAVPQLAWDARASQGGIIVTARNNGRDAVKLSKLAINGNAIDRSPFIYILPGAEHRFAAKAVAGPLHLTGYDARSGHNLAADIPAPP